MNYRNVLFECLLRSSVGVISSQRVATRRAELCRLVLTLKDHPSAAACFKAFQLVARNGQRILRTGRLVKGSSYRGELAENE